MSKESAMLVIDGNTIRREQRFLDVPHAGQHVWVSKTAIAAAGAYALTAWEAGLSLEMAKALLDQEWVIPRRAGQRA